MLTFLWILGALLVAAVVVESILLYRSEIIRKRWMHRAEEAEKLVKCYRSVNALMHAIQSPLDYNLGVALEYLEEIQESHPEIWKLTRTEEIGKDLPRIRHLRTAVEARKALKELAEMCRGKGMLGLSSVGMLMNKFRFAYRNEPCDSLFLFAIELWMTTRQELELAGRKPEDIDADEQTIVSHFKTILETQVVLKYASVKNSAAGWEALPKMVSGLRQTTGMDLGPFFKTFCERVHGATPTETDTEQKSAQAT